MKKLVPKLQSAWAPINYQTPENSEPKSAKPDVKRVVINGASSSNRPISVGKYSIESNLNEQLLGLRNRRLIEKSDQPLSGTDPVGQFWVEGEMIGRPLTWIAKPLVKVVRPYLLSLFPNVVNKTINNKGHILLLLGNHSKNTPRQLRIEPQGNNLFRVHASTWGGITDAQKKQLYEALYNEIPEGGEILFPKSSMDYLGTRGTVAGLRRLERDPRWTPSGSVQKLLYRDDKDGTIKIFEGTGFIKGGNRKSINGYTENDGLLKDDLTTFYEKVKELKLQYPTMIEGRVDYMPNSTIDYVSSKNGFTPVYHINPGNINSKYMTKVYLDRLRKAGYRLFEPVRMLNRGFMTTKTPHSYITENNSKRSILGYFDDKSYGGIYNRNSGLSLISPETDMKVPSILFHERNMHGTDNVIDALNAWKPYNDFLSKLYYDEAVIDGVPHSFPIDTKGLNLLEESANKEELRATIGELVRKFHSNVSKMYNNRKLKSTDINMDDLMAEYVDKMSDDELINALKTTNGYGNDYVKLSGNNSDFIKDLKNLIKYGYSIAVPAAVATQNK